MKGMAECNEILLPCSVTSKCLPCSSLLLHAVIKIVDTSLCMQVDTALLVLLATPPFRMWMQVLANNLIYSIWSVHTSLSHLEHGGFQVVYILYIIHEEIMMVIEMPTVDW